MGAGFGHYGPPSADEPDPPREVPLWIVAIFTVVLIVACVHHACKDIAAAILSRKP